MKNQLGFENAHTLMLLQGFAQSYIFSGEFDACGVML